MATLCFADDSDANSSIFLMLFSNVPKQVQSWNLTRGEGASWQGACAEGTSTRAEGEPGKRQQLRGRGGGCALCKRACLGGYSPLGSTLHPRLPMTMRRGINSCLTVHKEPYCSITSLAPSVHLAAQSETCPFSGRTQKKHCREA